MKLIDFCRESIRKDFKFKCDGDLPKYLRLNSKSQFKVKVPADEFGTPLVGELVDEPIGMSPLNYQQELQEAGITLTTNSVKDFIKSEDANKFNLTISDSLLATLKESKWWSGTSDNLTGSIHQDINLTDYIITSDASLTSTKTAVGVGTGLTYISPSEYKVGFWQRLKEAFTKRTKKVVSIDKDDVELETKKVANPNVEHKIEVIKFFDLIKVEIGKEKEFVDRVDTYVNLIKKAQSLHQTAQSEKLIKLLINQVYDSVLCVSGFNHYVTIEELQKLQSQCERVLDIDYISNFGRVIPDQVAELKLKADELGVFDNYLVLHYNPNGEIWKTEEEKRKAEEAKRDPILFGLINNSNRLYKIADWVDMYCDLTWEDIVDKIATGDLSTETTEDLLK